ncbi:MAG: hypothetical protein QG629_800 [Patescibacteria group bacterium]|nr:hypothetical protein [Candidatus Saccharibacteria bacterium]MDQ5963717.1 hypothetical protein [Patescibacteria group bacterium]
MASSRTGTMYAKGMPVRNDSRKVHKNSLATQNKFRADTRIERQLSIEGDHNVDLESWLNRFTRQNSALKNTRNLGGLSLTIIEDGVLGKALRRKYRDYGTDAYKTRAIQEKLRDSFAVFTAESRVATAVMQRDFGNADAYRQSQEGQWDEADVAIKARLRVMGGGVRSSLCVMVDSPALQSEYEGALDFLRNEERLNVQPDPKHQYLPHITITRSPTDHFKKLNVPDLPASLTVEAPIIAANITAQTR